MVSTPKGDASELGRLTNAGADMGRKYAAEFLGTILLVFFGAGSAALILGYKMFGSSLAAGIVAVALTFGLIYAALVYVAGPISGGHVNPAVTFGALVSGRIGILPAIGYILAQLAGSLIGALLVLWVMGTSPYYSLSTIGLGTNGYGAESILHISASGAFLVEVVLTTAFVLVVLSLTREDASTAVSGLGIGVALALANLIGIPFDGASVNPARSFGPAVIAGGVAFSQLWVFLVAPLIGSVLAAILHFAVHPLPEGFSVRRLLRRRAAQATDTPGGTQPIRPQEDADAGGPDEADEADGEGPERDDDE
jgi:aquaporin Z